MANYYGSLDLTLIGQIVRQQPELVREAQMKDGSTHKFLNIDVLGKEAVDQYGNAASVKVSCKKEQRIDGVKYFVANLKRSNYQSQAAPQSNTSAPQPAPAPAPAESPELPF